MSFPKGYRKLDDDEIIEGRHFRFRNDIGLVGPLFSRAIGKTRAYLLKLGQITSKTIYLEETDEIPRFPGWYHVGINVPILRGDRLIKIDGKDGSFSTPFLGLQLSHLIGRKISGSFSPSSVYLKGGWGLYRSRTIESLPQFKREMKLNPIFSAPRPLP